MRKFSMVFALMVATLFGGLLIESAAAQNSNSSTTMSNMSNMGRHRHRRRHRRHRRRMAKNMNM